MLVPICAEVVWRAPDTLTTTPELPKKLAWLPDPLPVKVRPPLEPARNWVLPSLEPMMVVKSRAVVAPEPLELSRKV